MSQLPECIICQISIVGSVAELKKAFYGSKECDISRSSNEWDYLLHIVALLIKSQTCALQGVVNIDILVCVIVCFCFFLLTLKKESSAPFSMNSVTIITGRLLVTTPSKRIMLGWSNWPIMEASDRKSRLWRSV